MILHDYDKIVRERQKAIRRQINERQLSIKAIHLDAGWENASSLLSYFPANQDVEPAVMSVAALYRLLHTGALPADLLSMLLPDGMAIVRVPEHMDHDKIADAFTDYLKDKNDFHHPESEAGRNLSPNETAALDDKVVHLPIKGVVNG